ncbi:DUF6900 domain-containing protein [Paraburkholderia fungorum]|uniref:DUF6900 domain-containing protein n=1 Tax=Paraburkholderia fungorum TaxID=134537 RepID=UPI0036F1D83F
MTCPPRRKAAACRNRHGDTRHGHPRSHSDRLDFYDTAIWSIRAALEAAYLTSVASTKAGTARTRPRPLAIRAFSNTTGAQTKIVRAFPERWHGRYPLATLATKSATT